MATDMIGGMFGPTPEEIRLAQYQQGAQTAADLSGMNATQRGVAGMMMGGAGLVNTLAPTFGFKNQALEQANARQEMMRGTDLNLQDPASLREAALRIRQVDPQMAMRLGMLANQREKEQSQMTLEAAQTKKALRDNPNLEKIEVPQGNDMYRMALLDSTGQRPLEYISGPYKGQKLGGGGSGSSVQPLPYIHPKTGKAVWGTIDEARGNVAAAYDPVTKLIVSAAAKEGTDLGADRADIGAKEGALESVGAALKLLDEGIFSGFYGEIGMQTARAIGGADAKAKVARTQEFVSSIGNIVIPRLQEFGGNDSVEELRYLQRVMAGDIAMEATALRNILKSAEKKIARGIERIKCGKTVNGEIIAAQKDREQEKPASTRIKFDAQGNMVK